MSNVISIKKYKEECYPHISGECKCLDCGHEWVGEAPVGVCILECPQCQTLRGVHKYDISRDEPYWTCNCGNKLFFITPNGTYCPKCGESQVGY
jgi:Zn finger protein HypA/HybF involved in hydrogenase expression